MEIMGRTPEAVIYFFKNQHIYYATLTGFCTFIYTTGYNHAIPSGFFTLVGIQLTRLAGYRVRHLFHGIVANGNTPPAAKAL
jgi:hypothetical protein